jgi:hypothetical protein
MSTINDTIIPAGHHVTITLPATGDPAVASSPISLASGGLRTARDGYRVGPRPRLQEASLGGH